MQIKLVVSGAAFVHIACVKPSQGPEVYEEEKSLFL